MAAKCAFGEQTEDLIMDTFIQNMNNKMVQQKLAPNRKKNHKRRSGSQLHTKKESANKKHLKLEQEK